MGCYIFMFIFVVGIVVSIYLIAGEEGQAKMTQQVKSFIGNIYPRFKDQPAELWSISFMPLLAIEVDFFRHSIEVSTDLAKSYALTIGRVV